MPRITQDQSRRKFAFVANICPIYTTDHILGSLTRNPGSKMTKKIFLTDFIEMLKQCLNIDIIKQFIFKFIINCYGVSSLPYVLKKFSFL